MNGNYLKMPSATNIQEAPELATLGVLNAALHACINTLAAAHPAMCDPDVPTKPYEPRTPLSTAARRIITCAVSLQARLIRYTTQLAEGYHGQLFLWEEFPWDSPTLLDDISGS